MRSLYPDCWRLFLRASRSKVLLLEEVKKGIGTIEKILVCCGEVDKALVKAKYFHRVVGVRELLESVSNGYLETC